MWTKADKGEVVDFFCFFFCGHPLWMTPNNWVLEKAGDSLEAIKRQELSHSGHITGKPSLCLKKELNQRTTTDDQEHRSSITLKHGLDWRWRNQREQQLMETAGKDWFMMKPTIGSRTAKEEDDDIPSSYSGT